MKNSLSTAKLRRELRERFGELLGVGLEFVDHRQDFARERADLVLDDRRRRVRTARAWLRWPGRAPARTARARAASGRARWRRVASLPRPLPRLVQRARQQVQRALEVRVPPWRTSRTPRWRRRRAAASCLSLPPSASISRRKLWIERAVFAWRISSCSAISCVRRAVGSKRLSVADERLAVVLQPFAGARQQLLQVGARFGVEAGEEFVEVDVRRGLGERAALRRCAACPADARAGVDLDGDVLQLRLRAQQQRRVAVDSCAYLGTMFIVTTATPSCRSTLAISPIFAPAIVTAWPWPGRRPPAPSGSRPSACSSCARAPAPSPGRLRFSCARM